MRRLRTTRTCKAHENQPPIRVALLDSNATQNDSIIVTSGGVINIGLSDSNATQADALDVTVDVVLSDSDATQVDTIGPATTVILADSNATENDTIAATVTPSLADSNATENDALIVSVAPPAFPPTGAIMAWRADSGIVGATPVTSWTDSIAGAVGAATSWDFNATEAGFNNQPGVDSTAANARFFVNASPAAALPFWVWGVILPGASLVSTILRTGFLLGDQWQIRLGGGAAGQIQLTSNAFSLTATPIDVSNPLQFSVFVGGAGQTSKLYINGVLMATSPLGSFTDATLAANNGFFIGNRQFFDVAEQTICEFGFSDNTFDQTSYHAYCQARYGTP